MAFELPDLPYAYDALAPYMSAETLEYHHDKHHQAYVTNGNKLLEGSGLEGKSLEEVGDKINPDQKAGIESAIAKVEETLRGEDVDAMKAATDELQRSMTELMAAAQAAGAGAGPATAGPDASDADEGADAGPRQAKGKVVDADFEVVDDEKKSV